MIGTPVAVTAVLGVSRRATFVAVTSPAKTAYGAAVSGWRGLSVVKPAPRLVRTPISSQRGGPVNTEAPKSTVMVNSPPVTAVAALVTGPAMIVPGLLA